MPEDKENIYGVSTRVPGWVMDEIEEEIKKRPRGKRPTRGEMLEAAWRIYRETPETENKVPICENNVPLRPGQAIEWPSEISRIAPPVTPQELALLVKTLHVLRSPAGPALASNIGQFDTLREFYVRFGASASQAGAEDAVGTDDAAIDRALDRAQRAIALVERLGRDAESTERGKDRADRPNRKRGTA